MVAQKGFSFLRLGFPLVVERTEADVRLALLGTGPDEAALRKQVGDAGIADKSYSSASVRTRAS